MPTFEISDEQVLKLSGVASAALALSSFAAPRQAHDALYEKTTVYSEPLTRMYGAALGASAAQTLAVSASDYSRDAKKNMLKVSGTSWLVCAAQSLYYANEDTMRKDVAYSHAAVAAVLGGLCLWRGFEEESKTTKEVGVNVRD